MVKNRTEMWEAGLILGLGRSPGERNGNPFQYSCLENPMDRKAWWGALLGVAKSQTQLSMHARAHTHTQIYPGGKSESIPWWLRG